MNGIIKLELGGKERVLRFNTFSAIEIRKVLFPEDSEKDYEIDQVTEKLLQLNAKNHFLLIKLLIYAGIIGNDFVVGFTESTTIEEVGEWVSTMSKTDLVKVWDCFWDAKGFNIPKDETQIQEDSVQEKKS